MNAEERKTNQSEEDYLESILILSGQLPVVHRIEVAKRLGVSQAAVNKAVKLLRARGHVYEDGKHLYLTESGQGICLRRLRKALYHPRLSDRPRRLPRSGGIGRL